MLRHATHTSPFSGRRYAVKTVPCRKCGAPVEYTTCPKWYCSACLYRSPSKANRTLESRLRRMGVKEAKRLEAEIVVNARPGFCTRCGIIRAEVGELCYDCHKETR